MPLWGQKYQPQEMLATWVTDSSPLYLIGNYLQLLRTARPKVKPAEIQAVSGWYRGAKPGFSWGQICRVILVPELPVELARGFQSIYVESWFSSCSVLSFSHLCRCIPKGLSPICLSPSEFVLRKPTRKHPFINLHFKKLCFYRKEKKKSLYFGWE